MTRVARDSSSDVARTARGACAALLAAALLCAVEFAARASARDIPRVDSGSSLASEVLAALVLLQLGARTAWSAARRISPEHPARALALIGVPLAVALTRARFAAHARDEPWGALLLLGVCVALVLLIAATASGVAWVERSSPRGATGDGPRTDARARLRAGMLAAACLLAGALALCNGPASDAPRPSSLVAACAAVLGASLLARVCLPAPGRATTFGGVLAVLLAFASLGSWWAGDAGTGVSRRSDPDDPPSFGTPSGRTAPALLGGLSGLVRDFARGEDGPSNLLRSSRALDHEVWQRGNNPPEIERDVIVAPDGTLSAERVRFPAVLSLIMQDSETPARGRRFVARVWVRRLDDAPDDAQDAARLAILIRAGTGGPYGQSLERPTSAWREVVFEHTFADDAPTDGVFLRFGNDHGDPRALDVALWDARLELLEGGD